MTASHSSSDTDYACNPKVTPLPDCSHHSMPDSDVSVKDNRDSNVQALSCHSQVDSTVLEQRIAIAKQTCQSQGIRFTPLREQVYRLILQAPTPIGAYDLLAQLQKLSDKTVAPPTVYRSLDFLLEYGFVHQLSSSKVFFPCCQPDDKHVAAFLICQQCGDVQEFSHSPLDSVIQQVASQSQFDIQSSVIELLGYCQQCKEKSATKRSIG